VKYIKKLDTEPKVLSNWKEQDKMYKRGKAKWKRFRNPDKKNFHKFLIDEQKSICCYCEQKIIIDESHLEHLLAQNLDTYSEYLFEYNNLLCSCQRKLEKGEPRHCGNSKGSHILPITPLESNCETKFTYTEDGYIDGINDDAKKTIEILQLDIDNLNNLRANAIEPFLIDPITLEEITEEDRKHFVQDYLQTQNATLNEFHTTIKYLFE